MSIAFRLRFLPLLRIWWSPISFSSIAIRLEPPVSSPVLQDALLLALEYIHESIVVDGADSIYLLILFLCRAMV